MFSKKPLQLSSEAAAQVNNTNVMDFPGYLCVSDSSRALEVLFFPKEASELMKESKSLPQFKSLTYKNFKSNSGNATFLTISPGKHQVLINAIAAPAMRNGRGYIIDSIDNLSKIAQQLDTLHSLNWSRNSMIGMGQKKGKELLDYVDSIVDKIFESILNEKDAHVLVDNVLPKISNFLGSEILRLEAIKLEENEKNAIMDERTTSSSTPRI